MTNMLQPTNSIQTITLTPSHPTPLPLIPSHPTSSHSGTRRQTCPILLTLSEQPQSHSPHPTPSHLLSPLAPPLSLSPHFLSFSGTRRQTCPIRRIHPGRVENLHQYLGAIGSDGGGDIGRWAGLSSIDHWPHSGCRTYIYATPTPTSTLSYYRHTLLLSTLSLTIDTLIFIMNMDECVQCEQNIT